MSSLIFSAVISTKLPETLSELIEVIFRSQGTFLALSSYGFRQKNKIYTYNKQLNFQPALIQKLFFGFFWQRIEVFIENLLDHIPIEMMTLDILL